LSGVKKATTREGRWPLGRADAMAVVTRATAAANPRGDFSTAGLARERATVVTGAVRRNMVGVGTVVGRRRRGGRADTIPNGQRCCAE